MGWYGYTKLQAEKETIKINPKIAIVRISFPFGDLTHEKDYINKTKKVIAAGYPIFADQFITPTFLPDLVAALEVISQKELAGIYHVATSPVTTPYKFARVLSKNIKKGSVKKYLANQNVAKRPIWGGLDTTYTEKILNLKFTSLSKSLPTIVEHQ